MEGELISNDEDEFRFLSELYIEDAADATLLAEYPSSNSDDTVFQNRTRFIIHDPFPPPRRELLKVLGPHHLMCGWGKRLPVSSEIKPPEMLLEHWRQMLGDDAVPTWQSLDETSQYITLFPHQSLEAVRQTIDPETNYALHSKEVIEQIACPQADVLTTVEPPCIVKLTHGYAGLGNFLIESDADEARMRQQLDQHWPDASLVINSVIENIVGDYGVQFYLRRNGSVVPLGFTQQNFDANKRWCGGVFSSSLQSELMASFDAIIQATASHLHSSGYFGVVGIDILLDKDQQQFLVDVNPRLTGISPFLMASKIFAAEPNFEEGIYRASCRYKGSMRQLIDAAESIDDAKVLVLSAFEEEVGQGSTETLCHLSVSSTSQKRNEELFQALLED